MSLCYRACSAAQVMISGVPLIRMDAEELAFMYAGDSTGNNSLGKLGEKIFQRRLGRGEREAVMR